MSRLYFLRRLRSFSVCSRMLHMFYLSVMASTIFFAVVCWGAGMKLANLDEVVRDRMVLKLRTIMDNPSHPLHNTVDKLRSSFSNSLDALRNGTGSPSCRPPSNCITHPSLSELSSLDRTYASAQVQTIQ
ncbi:hypothetical protein D4764_16G0001720 [Takifugu flavidus]|uniref:Alkylated DNA repair protein AlkB homologue 8 N-terminal domain-containing protein n=1 Tax=Takifugu flavidus TaxID=433684 RepID=A0A5C6NXG6_9TELE|nr:hypothetical protein D4764_16G0001720 [Takifugu flavidus]